MKYFIRGFSVFSVLVLAACGTRNIENNGVDSQGMMLKD